MALPHPSPLDPVSLAQPRCFILGGMTTKRLLGVKAACPTDPNLQNFSSDIINSSLPFPRQCEANHDSKNGARAESKRAGLTCTLI
jgi:hypothetical protein